MAGYSNAEGNKMQCHFCAGEIKKGKTTYTLNGTGYHLLIDDVPAWICKQCNEAYFEENVVEIVQGIIMKLNIVVNKLRQSACGKSGAVS